MGVIYQIPSGSIAMCQTITAQAIFDIPTGRYIFPSLPQDIMQINEKSLYLIESLTVSANVSPDIYYNSILETPKISFVGSSIGEFLQHLPTSITLSSIGIQSIFSGFFYSDRNESLQIVTSGALQQIIDTIDMPTIDIVINAVIHRVLKQEFIDKIRREW